MDRPGSPQDGSSDEQSLKVLPPQGARPSARRPVGGFGSGRVSPAKDDGTSEGSPASSRPASRGADGIFDVALQHSWLVVDPWNDPSLPEVPADCEVILVLAELKDLSVTRRVLEGLAQSGRDFQLPPIVVVVLHDNPCSVPDVDEFHAARSSFISICALDVILQPRSDQELELEVDGCLARDEAYKASIAKELEALEAAHIQATTQLEEAAQAERERLNSTFFAVVHRFLSDFPKMQYSAKAKPSEGAEVESHLLQRQLNKKASPEVYLALNQTTGQVEVLKFFKKDAMNSIEDVHKVWNEFRILRSLHHQGVVKFRHIVHLRHVVFISMDSAGERNMQHLLREAKKGKLPVSKAQNLTSQLMKAVAYCHHKGVGHRDICFANIMVPDDGILRLVGFSSAVKLGKLCSKAAGTMPFMAPEVLAPGDYDAASSDVWACGVMLLEMMCGIGTTARLCGWSERPGGVQALQPAALASDVMRAFAGAESSSAVRALSEALNEEAPEELLGVTAHVLHVNPAQRWTASQASLCAWLISG